MLTNIIRNRIVSDIRCSIPSTHTQALYAINPPSPPDFWEMTLGHLSGLRYVTLSDGYMPDLVSLLALPGDEPKGHVTSDRDLTRDHKFVPVLEELEFYCIQHLPRKLLLDALSTRKARYPRLTVIDSTIVGEDEVGLHE